MNSLTLSTDEHNVKTTNPWLVTVLKFAQRINFFKPFEQFTLPMKKVNYSALQKIQTLIASIAVGCQYTCEINRTLVPDTAAAKIIEMDRFPDQSQVNRFLTRCNADNIAQLKAIHQELFAAHHLIETTGNKVVVDIDQSGLVANGKTYEAAGKGYFPHKRGRKGYQLSAAFTGQTGQALSLYLDPGNTHCLDRFSNLIADVALCFKDCTPEVIIRGDSGYGSADSIAALQAAGMHFIIKGYSNQRACRQAKEVREEDWQEIERLIHVAELASGTPDLRVIICETITRNGKRVYTRLLTDITWLSPVELFHFYNERQTIEAFFKLCKHTYGIRNLRTGNYDGIHTFLWLVLITHNLLIWLKGLLLRDIPLEKAGVRSIIDKVGRLRVAIRETKGGIAFFLPDLNSLVRIVLDSCRTKRPLQLEFPFFT